MTKPAYDAAESEKAAIRRNVLARRNAMPAQLRARKSAIIADMALSRLDEQLDWPPRHDYGRSASPTACHATPQPLPPIVAAFWPFGSEVDTRPLIAGIVARGWRLALPCMMRSFQPSPECRKPAAMRFLQIDSQRLDEAVSRFAAKPISSHTPNEPWMATFPTVDIPDIGAFVVPLVAFDDEGNRLGYGGGNYDRALPLASPNAVIIGIAFDEQRVPTVPTLPHDVRIPIISS